MKNGRNVIHIMFKNLAALICRRLYIKNVLTTQEIIHELVLPPEST